MVSIEDCPTYAEIRTCTACPAYLNIIQMRRVNEFDWEEIPGTEVISCSKKYF